MARALKSYGNIRHSSPPSPPDVLRRLVVPVFIYKIISVGRRRENLKGKA